ncbi:MAG: hypothetical protein M1820_010782 [Bogoriella megaspora]|nr:MAG: hypothetical protein M1820_010782 [Bogoriella megaspora]
MPAFDSTPLLNALISRDAASGPLVDQAVNTSTNALQVVCAWPVSGQYGPGSRVLYYVLVAACVVAQKAEWLRNACLAAALLFPAVAALHGIVLAATHVTGAVDMDVFGAFQLCSIGILAGPVTVRLSRTYFNDPGRNTIFIWTTLVLAGLLSLTVEFYRINTSPCTHDDNGSPIAPKASAFPYGENPSCGLVCSIEDGPFSPMRKGSANNIYVIPRPERLTFGTATLLAAACCIPAILSLMSMWTKILEINWKKRFGNREEQLDEPIEGTNHATIRQMRGVNDMVRRFLSVIEVPLFSGAILAILITGERNLNSKQVKYQTEPLQSVGQWAPIVGTALAAVGSLYLLLATSPDPTRPGARRLSMTVPMHHCNCSHHHLDHEGHPTGFSPEINDSPSSRDTRSLNGAYTEGPTPKATGIPEMQQINTRLSTSSHPPSPGDLTTTPTYPDSTAEAHPHLERLHTIDVGSRRKVAKTLTRIGNFFGTAPEDWNNDSEFKQGRSADFPEIPGEEHRNRNLPQIRQQYNPRRDSQGHATPVPGGSRSRASSLNRSVVEEEREEESGESSERDEGAVRRRDTLEVPGQVHVAPTRSSTR